MLRMPSGSKAVDERWKAQKKKRIEKKKKKKREGNVKTRRLVPCEVEVPNIRISCYIFISGFWYFKEQTTAIRNWKTDFLLVDLFFLEDRKQYNCI